MLIIAQAFDIWGRKVGVVGQMKVVCNPLESFHYYFAIFKLIWTLGSPKESRHYK
jgi:hypothetical protein